MSPDLLVHATCVVESVCLLLDLIRRLSIAIDAENLENVTQFPQFRSLDRYHFLMALGTPCYHTFVILRRSSTSE